MEHAERRRHDDAAVFRAETFRPGALGAMRCYTRLSVQGPIHAKGC